MEASLRFVKPGCDRRRSSEGQWTHCNLSVRAGEERQGFSCSEGYFCMAWQVPFTCVVVFCWKRDCSAPCRFENDPGANSGLKEEDLEQQREFINSCWHFGPADVHNSGLLFLAKEGNAQRDLSVKKHAFKKDRYFTVLSLLKALHCKY